VNSSPCSARPQDDRESGFEAFAAQSFSQSEAYPAGAADQTIAIRAGSARPAIGALTAFDVQRLRRWRGRCRRGGARPHRGTSLIPVLRRGSGRSARSLGVKPILSNRADCRSSADEGVHAGGNVAVEKDENRAPMQERHTISADRSRPSVGLGCVAVGPGKRLSADADVTWGEGEVVRDVALVALLAIPREPHGGGAVRIGIHAEVGYV
jgi:hypothetical protein